MGLDFEWVKPNVVQCLGCGVFIEYPQGLLDNSEYIQEIRDIHELDCPAFWLDGQEGSVSGKNN